jgi:undecaprenyl diphosphate synthase
MTLAVLPQHVAMIMDGNGRWAKARGLPRTVGHKAATSRVRELVRACAERHIPVLTVYAFSSENWARPTEEVGVLMSMYVFYLRKEAKTLHRNNIKIKIIGHIASLAQELQQVIAEIETLTHHNTGLQLNIAINYGGRAEMLYITQMIAREVLAGQLDPHTLTETMIEQKLYTAGQPMVDLMIRTGGVSRISNFLLWQAAYSEFYFTDVLFPDFDCQQFTLALEWFAQQTRRFGKIDEQLKGTTHG